MRAQATLGATAVAGIALAIGAIGFTGVLNASLQDVSARAAQNRASEILDRLDRDGAGFVRSVDDGIVVVVDREGNVIAASEDVPESGITLPISESPERVTIDREPMLVVSAHRDTDNAPDTDNDNDNDPDDDNAPDPDTDNAPNPNKGGGRDRGQTVLVAVPIDDNLTAVNTVTVLLTFAVPLLVAVIGVITWVIVGRALAPVARIRAEVDDISAERLDRRVPVPPSGDEIAALASTMNEMLNRLDASAKAQRQFISDASHELRSPIATIRQHAELSQTHPEVTSVAELAGVVHGEGLRLQGLVDSLLLLARLDEGATTAHTSVDLDDLALTEASRLRQSAAVTVDGAGIGPARVRGDARLIGQLMRNLADNAARHARATVAFTVREQGGWATVTVEDDGAGVPEDQRERVFERFVRLDEARDRDSGGSGLGLAIVRSIATASGGWVSVDESRWGGARFIVTVPAAVDD